MGSKQDLLDWLYGLTVHGIKLGLTNTTELLHRLGDPQNSFRKVHVAGTDGKGSTSAIIASILESSGVRTGLYTSPHIIDFNERISVSGENITDSELSLFVSIIRPIVEDMRENGMQCTFFEVTTALAFLYFKERDVEYAVIEVGMGGRFDATNVIVPDVSVITNISMEHTEYLGHTIEKISAEKAGIIKARVPVVTINEGKPLDIIKENAEKLSARMITVNPPEVTSVSEDRTEFTYKGVKYTVMIPGRYQAANACMAIEAVGNLPRRERFIPNIQKGLRDVRWPCRMQKLDGLPIILDVTHTKAGSKVLAENIAEIYGKVTMVFGVLSDKDIDGIADNLSSIASKVIITTPISDRAADIGKVEETVRKYFETVIVEPSVFDAFDKGMEIRGEEQLLITGSFIMAEDALKWLKRTSAGS
ncbi:MAG: bifunctional folylpolyglutamate synthase/dihydrofolate synthase [Candidatus Methanomethylophilaceae archaeon]|nr:bifunctional folylpolyglutamate synthase/dihydrofolate synthase [Candidatus Methanomethylophilaceae archaeon]